MPRTPEQTAEYNKRYYEKHKERLVAYAKDYRANNVEKVRERDRERYAKNPEKRKMQHAASAKRCAKRKYEYNKAWRTKNCDRARATRLAYSKRKRESDVEYVLRNRVSCSLYDALRRGKSGRTFSEIVGWSIQELRVHLARQFARGMSWSNIGEWHIDHIIPLSAFELSRGKDEIRKAWALTNLRPLWATDNIRKGHRLEFLL